MLIIVAVFSALALAGAGLYSWHRATPDRALPPVDRGAPSVFDLRLGDVVQHLGTDYLVESSIHYDDQGTTWHSHLLSGGEGDRWLVVEEDDKVVIALCEEIDDLTVRPGGGAPPKSVEYRGHRYRLTGSGAATARRKRPGTGDEQTLRCHYWDFAGPDGQVLYVEDWPGERELFHGRRISGAALTILPAS